MTASAQRISVFLFLALIAGVVLGWTARGTLDSAEDAVQIQEEPPAIAEHELVNETQAASKSGESEARSSNRPTLVTAMSQDGGAETEFEHQQAIPQAPQSKVERRTIPVSDAHAGFIQNQFTEDEETGERRAVRDVLELEAKDDSWSYFMEQTLQMFISSHANADKFSIFHIECRTTMCEIQAIGFDASTRPDWSRILYDMSLQPWYEFGQVGTTNGDFQGQLAILTRLTRTQ